MEHYKVEATVASTEKGFRIKQVRCNDMPISRVPVDYYPETYIIKGNQDVETSIGVYDRPRPLEMPWPIKKLEQDHTFVIELTIATGEDLSATVLAECSPEVRDWAMTYDHEVVKVIVDGQEMQSQFGAGYDDSKYWPLIVEEDKALVIGHYANG